MKRGMLFRATGEAMWRVGGQVLLDSWCPSKFRVKLNPDKNKTYLT